MKTRIKRTLWMATAMLAGAGAVSLAGEAEKKETYPIDVCIVSGMKLGTMGDPYVHVHEEREVQFCCRGCKGKFDADADGHMARLDQLISEKQESEQEKTQEPTVKKHERMSGQGHRTHGSHKH